jgi:hypothetical protein
MYLARGQFLLKAALRDNGDILSWYEQALDSFDRARQSMDGANRREAERAYAETLSYQRVVLSRSRLLAKRKATDPAGRPK